MQRETTALAVFSSLVCLAFAASSYERWLRSRRDHELSWTIALAFSAVAAAALGWGSALGWSATGFRVFYTFGAVMNVPVLALGQLQIMSRSPKARRWVAQLRTAVGLSVAFGAGVVFFAPMHGQVGTSGSQLPQGSEVFGAAPRILAAVSSGLGATVVFVGALVSAFGALRRRSHIAGLIDGGRDSAPSAARRAVGTVLIAAGTIILSLSGTLNSVLGEMEAFAVTLAAGIAVLFAGFLVATTTTSAARSSAPRWSRGSAGPRVANGA